MVNERAPEQTVELRPAGFVTRLVAFFIDQVIVGMTLFILTAIVGVVFRSFRLSELLGAVDLTLQLVTIPLGAAGLILSFFYYVGFWLLAGQTPGKALLGLVIVQADGGPLRPGPAIVRWLGYWLSGILFLGYLWILVDDRRQALHDKLARTLVVHRGLDERFSDLPDQVQAKWRDLERTHRPDAIHSDAVVVTEERRNDGRREQSREPLSGVDAALLELETPSNLTVINAIMILAEPIAFDDLKAVIQNRLVAIHRFRQRVVPSAGPLSNLYWEDDPDFDIANHLHRTVLPPSTEPPQPALQNLVSELASVPLDGSRPLWELHLVEGYGAGCALICRIHHAIGDGAVLTQVILSITDSEPRPLLATLPPERVASPLQGAAVVSTGRRRSAWRPLRQGGASAVPPSRLTAPMVAGWRAASALGGLVLALPDSKTTFKGVIGCRKRVAWSAPIPLDQVKATGRALDGTVNDTILAAVSGALRRYLHERGEPTKRVRLRAVVPVSLRTGVTANQLGNRIGAVVLPLPVAVGDPARRMEVVRRSMNRLKRSHLAPVTFAGIQALSLAPLSLKRTAARFVANRSTAIITNVIGPKEPRYLAGAPVETLLFWVPKIDGLALGVSILSYAGQVRLGIITDRDLVPDPEMIVAAFQTEYDALFSLTHEGRATVRAREASAVPDRASMALESVS